MRTIGPLRSREGPAGRHRAPKAHGRAGRFITNRLGRDGEAQNAMLTALATGLGLGELAAELLVGRGVAGAGGVLERR